ncbi:hypothetical protein BDBG_02006 [Blastomyces gilchristii SLH14081]|uniref:Uncharacterized protein n=1 Tax=Blastomyces gilchristii (strain SLH14081) TaxID=559298 RepID=A0A179UES1_BLAGS|nr:uncharacterized protein BDBG_02006 [Blastomyces gilchristii SLH14081]OAT05647.1 hypothetical protein BDBG_02006 [Blastomyces gilchristii SLH14081]
MRNLLFARIEILNEAMQDILPTDEVRPEDVVGMFKLKCDKDPSIWDLPCTLLSDLDHISSGRKSEGLVRCRLSLILLNCLAAEERCYNAVISDQSIAPPDSEIIPGQASPTLSDASWCPVGPEIVRLSVETPLSSAVEYNGRARLLYGTADFALWYGSAKEMASNLVVVGSDGWGDHGAAGGGKMFGPYEYVSCIRGGRRAEGRTLLFMEYAAMVSSSISSEFITTLRKYFQLAKVQGTTVDLVFENWFRT